MSRDQSAPGVSVLGRGARFVGNLACEGSLRIDGELAGDVDCRATVTIGADGVVRGNVRARDAHVAGRIEGDLACEGSIRLTGNARVRGDLRAMILEMDEGCAASGEYLVGAAMMTGQQTERSAS